MLQDFVQPNSTETRWGCNCDEQPINNWSVGNWDMKQSKDFGNDSITQGRNYGYLIEIIACYEICNVNCEILNQLRFEVLDGILH